MALMMEPGRTEPLNEEEDADMAAIEAIRESAVTELKDQGNDFVKKGKKHYKDAIDCYTRAINQKTKDASMNSILYGNRAQVNLLLGNYRRAIDDADEAVKLNPSNVKAFYRGAKAALSLGLWPKVAELCSEGLNVEPANKELQSMKKQVEEKQAAAAESKRRALEIKSKAEALVLALEKRKLRLGQSKYRQHTGLRRPSLDRSGILHWPVLFLYGEYMTSDLIEDFPETDMFKPHLETMFGNNAPRLTWDTANAYKRDRIELYYQTHVGPVLSKKQLLTSLMEGEVGLEGLDLDGGGEDTAHADSGERRWVKVQERTTLHEVIAQPKHIIPGIPVFYVVATGTSFREKFLKEWSPP
ncbi:tetratricopeptide repeat protein 4 [Marchantia polymorpha subsp. ruderalis]